MVPKQGVDAIKGGSERWESAPLAGRTFCLAQTKKRALADRVVVTHLLVVCHAILSCRR